MRKQTVKGICDKVERLTAKQKAELLNAICKAGQAQTAEVQTIAEAYNKADQSAREKILKALTPTISAEKTKYELTKEEAGKMVLAFLSLVATNPRYVQAVRLAIEAQTADMLTKDEAFILEQALSLVRFWPEYADEAAARLGIIAERLTALSARRYEDEQSEFLFEEAKPTKEESEAAFIQTVQRQGYLERIKELFFPISKLSQKAGLLISGQERTITIEKKHYELKTEFYAPKEKDGRPGRLTTYRREVETAISNLVAQRGAKDKYGKEICYTLEQIYCAMNGTDPGDYISPAALRDLETAIKFLNNTEMRVKEVIDDVESTEAVVTGRVIDAVEGKVKNRMRTIKKAYIFSRTGLLYEFNRHSNKLLTVPREILCISSGYWRRGELGSGAEISAAAPSRNKADWREVKPSITELSITIRSYLLSQIFRIQNTASLAPEENKITYDAIFRDEADPALVEYNEDGSIALVKLGNTSVPKLKEPRTDAERKTAEKKKAQRRKLTLEILGHFQAQGLISGFSEITDGRKKTGVTIRTDKTTRAQRAILKAADQSAKIKRLSKREPQI